MQEYRDHRPTFEDRGSWTTPAVLRARAARHGERTWLEVPSTGEAYTFGETLELAERVGSGLLARGHEPGDRLVIMAPNSSDHLFAWLGSSVAGMAEVPINTAYKGTFFEHQVSTVAPSAAVVSPDLVDRFVESRDACTAVRRVYVVDAPRDELDAAIAELRAAGYDAEPFSALRSAEIGDLPEVTLAGPRVGLLHLGDHGTVQGRDDAARAHAPLRR